MTRKLFICSITCPAMPSKTISISEEAYHHLLEEKKSGESFTATIKRLTLKGKLSDSFDTWEGTDEEFTEIERSIGKGWKRPGSKDAGQ